MKNIKISVIVPIYNTEKYIYGCINSIISQKYKNIEIILVDDGSLDNCPSICDELSKKDNRVKVIHKKNEGLGYARNSGLDIATGDYVIFTDSDDILDLNTIDTIVENLNEKNYDMILYGFKYMDVEDNILKEFIPSPEKYEYIGHKEVVNEFLPHLVNVLPNEKNFNMNFSSCMCCINRKIIEDAKWRFVSERQILSEDIYSLIVLYNHINSVKILDKSFYNYRINSNSLTHVYREDRFEKVKNMYFELLKIDFNNNLKERFDYLFLSYVIGCIKSIVLSNNKYNYKKNKIKEIIEDEDLNVIVNNFLEKETLKRKIYFYLFKKKRILGIYLLTYIQTKKTVR